MKESKASKKYINSIDILVGLYCPKTISTRRKDQQKARKKYVNVSTFLSFRYLIILRITTSFLPIFIINAEN
jgi:hypothetical protein